jgi:hypothetical protein
MLSLFNLNQTKMNPRIKNGFAAGTLGAAILVVIMYITKAMGMGNPGFVEMYRAEFGASSMADHFIAAILFLISGGIWGIIFAILIKNPTILKGFLFGIVPTLWLWTAVNAFMGKPLFNDFELKGLLMPVIFNMVIWGSFVGWYTSRKAPLVTAG